MKYNIEHLEKYEEFAVGPVQSDEALLLYALTRVIRPKVIVEFGFLEGFSARNFLEALPKNGLLYSYDIDERCKAIAKDIHDNRFRFILKRQEDFEPFDIGNRPIDMLFIDSSHELKSNIALFERIKDCLSKAALVIVHDTGTWNKGLITDDIMAYKRHMLAVEKEVKDAHVNKTEFAHQPYERMFVDYIKSVHPEFEEINLHSLNTVRHGMTILQRYKKLSSWHADDTNRTGGAKVSAISRDPQSLIKRIKNKLFNRGR